MPAPKKRLIAAEDLYDLQQLSDVQISPDGRQVVYRLQEKKQLLDHLAQAGVSVGALLDVLAGDMSIVGPRPHAVAHNDLYRELIKAYMVRHKVKPGITGWAQVNYPYGASVADAKLKLEYDLYYLRHWSLSLDLRILLMTVWAALGPAVRK